MKNKILLLLILFISLIGIPVVFAKDDTSQKRCFYQYYSPEYGFTYAVINISQDGKASGAITTFNSQARKGAGGSGNIEKPYGWDFDTYKDHNMVCPYYAEIEESGGIAAASITLSYTKHVVKDLHDMRMDKAETHVAYSTTIKADKEANGETYDENMDSYIRSDAGETVPETDLLQNITVCRYTISTEDRQTFGYTSADLIYGYDVATNSRTIIGYMSMVNGDDDLGLANRIFKSYDSAISDPEGVLDGGFNGNCPYYVFYENYVSNSFTVLNHPSSDQATKELSKKQIQILLPNQDIANIKPGYNPSVDGTPSTAATEGDRARSRSRAYGWGSGSGEGDDPFDIYQGNIGDSFCSQPETMRGSKSLGIFVLIVRVFVPILLIIWGTLDIVKVVTTGTDDSVKSNFTKFGFRILIGLFVFFAPTIIDAIFSSFVYFKVVNSDYEKCEKCIFHPFNTTYCNAETVKTDDSNIDAMDDVDTVKSSLVNSFDITTTKKIQPGVIIPDPDKDNIIQ